MNEASEAGLKASRKVSEDNLPSAQYRVHELECKKHTIDNLASKVEEAEDMLIASQKDVKFHEYCLVEQSNQLLAKDAKTIRELECLAKL